MAIYFLYAADFESPRRSPVRAECLDIQPAVIIRIVHIGQTAEQLLAVASAVLYFNSFLQSYSPVNNFLNRHTETFLNARSALRSALPLS